MMCSNLKFIYRKAITRKQERAFLEFVKNDKHFCRYYDGIYILFKTGLRISEFVGLTKNDIEFDNHRIKVDYQLQRTRSMEYVIEDTKTPSGIRYIPIKKDVEECFWRILSERVKAKVEPIINGYAGFFVFGQER